MIVDGFNYTDTNITTADSLLQDVLNLGASRYWFEADARYVTSANGTISAFADRKGTTATFSQGTAANQAAVATDTIGPNTSAQVATFVGTSGFNNYAWGGPTQPDLTLPHSIVAVFKPGDHSASRNLFGSFTSSSVREILTFDIAGNLNYQYGTSSIVIPAASISSGWNAVVASFDGVNLNAVLNGKRSTAVAAAGSPGTATLELGALNAGGSQPWDGKLRALGFFSGNILGSAPASAAVLNYFSQALGIG